MLEISENVKECWEYVHAFNTLIICLEKSERKKNYEKKEEEKEQIIKGDKMPQSKWWKQCICTVLEIRMHEYVENMVNG